MPSESLSILITDADTSLAGSIQQVFGDRTVDVVSCASLSEAQRCVTERAFSGVVLSTTLATSSPKELVAAVRGSAHNVKTPIILLGGFDFAFPPAFSKEDPLVLFLPRPFRWDRLRHFVLNDGTAEDHRAAEVGPRVTSGLLTKEPFAVLLPRLYAHRQSGTLLLQNDKVSKRIFFLQGIPVGADSNIRAENLGQFLVKTGKLTNEGLTRVIEYMMDRCCMQGRALVSLGYLQEAQLYGVLKSHVIEKIVHAFPWHEGEYKWQEEHRFLENESLFDLPLGEIYREGLLFDIADLDRKRLIQSLERKSPQIRGDFLTGVTQLGFSLHEVQELMEARYSLEENFWLTLLTLNDFGFIRFVEAPREEVPPAAASAAKSSSDAGERSDEDLAQAERVLSAYLDTRKKNYFEMLEVTPEADRRELKRAYHALAKRFHPDRFRGRLHGEYLRVAEGLFTLISLAYQTLSQEASRKHYLEEVMPRVQSQESNRLRNQDDLIHAEALYLKGESAFRSRQFEQAAQYFEEACKRGPNEPQFAMAKAFVAYLQEKGDRDELLTACKKQCAGALRGDPHEFLGRLILGVLLGDEDQIQASIHELQEALKQRPNDPDALKAMRLNVEGKTQNPCLSTRVFLEP